MDGRYAPWRSRFVSFFLPYLDPLQYQNKRHFRLVEVSPVNGCCLHFASMCLKSASKCIFRSAPISKQKAFSASWGFLGERMLPSFFLRYPIPSETVSHPISYPIRNGISSYLFFISCLSYLFEYLILRVSIFLTIFSLKCLVLLFQVSIFSCLSFHLSSLLNVCLFIEVVFWMSIFSKNLSFDCPSFSKSVCLFIQIISSFFFPVRDTKRRVFLEPCSQTP